MRLAYDPSHYRDNTNLKETIDAVARLGYEWVELSPRKDFIWFYEYPKVDRQLIKDLKDIVQMRVFESLPSFLFNNGLHQMNKNAKLP